MKFLRVCLGVLIAAALWAPAAAAQWRVLQSRDADRELFVVHGPGGVEVRDRDSTTAVELPAGVRLSSIESLDDGWIVAGTRTLEARIDLWLAIGGMDGAMELPPPRKTDLYAHQPVPLVEHGDLVGLAWLEGERHDALAVRAAVRSGRGWSDPITVSEPDLASQLALSGAVLPDGSWQLAWSAVEGGHDDVFSARRRVDGNWEPRRRVNEPDELPDIQPEIVATHDGSLIVWNELHEGHYRVRLVRQDLGGRQRIGLTGPAGSVKPRLLAGEEGAVLLFREVIPDRWTALELDSAGAPRRLAHLAGHGSSPPVVTRIAEGVRFFWGAALEDRPFGAAETAVDTEVEVPWRAWYPEISNLEAEGLRGFSAATASPPEPASATDVIFRAFGDSITRGSGAPYFGNIIFDIVESGESGIPGPACGHPNPDPFSVLCGYNWRLEDALTPTFGADVANDGLGGESTADGLSRIDSILPGSDVVLIMEGSNDITNCATSPEAIRDAIAEMVDKATLEGVDSVIASVAKRRRIDANGNPIAEPCPETAMTADLRNKLQTLATNKNRAFADVWSALDPNLGPVDYWNGDPAKAPDGDGVGHPDASGYAKIEPKFSAPILADSPLGAPNPLTPSGNVNATPTFSWDKQTGARLYRVEVSGTGAPAPSWHDSLAACPTSVCSVSLGTFGAGSYAWKVAGKNLRGLGSFSSDLAFQVYTTAPGSAPTTGDPAGDSAGCDPNPPAAFLTYNFSEVTDATDYELELSDSGGVISVESFLASSICSLGNCAATSGTGLLAGDYMWRVRGMNPAGNGPWSASTAFSLYPTDIFLDAGNTGSNTYRACPGSVVSQAGFVVSSGETVTLRGFSVVVVEAIEIQSGATVTMRAD